MNVCFCARFKHVAVCVGDEAFARGECIASHGTCTLPRKLSRSSGLDIVGDKQLLSDARRGGFSGAETSKDDEAPMDSKLVGFLCCYLTSDRIVALVPEFFGCFLLVCLFCSCQGRRMTGTWGLARESGWSACGGVLRGCCYPAA